MPIPRLLVYSGFNQNLDTLTVYDRAKALHDAEDQDLTMFLSFLKDYMVSRTQRDPNT